MYKVTVSILNKKASFANEAIKITRNAYAPYSNFLVGAAAELINGQIVTATNQENASFAAGLCAERVLLATVSSMFTQIPVKTIALSYHNKNGKSDHPIFPCGICRQNLIEYESRIKNSIRLISGGSEGKIFIIPSMKMLLPLSFTSEDLI